MKAIHQPLCSPLPALKHPDEENPAIDEESQSPLSWNTPVPLDVIWRSPTNSSSFESPSTYPSKSYNNLCYASIWTNGIKHYRVVLLLAATVLLWPWGFVSFYNLENKTETAFIPATGSPSKLALDVMSSIYQNDWRDPMDPTVYVVLESSHESLSNQSSLEYSEARNYTMGLRTFLSNHCWHKAGTKNCMHNDFFQVTSYYSLIEKKIPRLARDWITPDGLATMIEIKYLLPSHSKLQAEEIVSEILASMKGYGSCPNLKISHAAGDWMHSGLIKADQRGLYKMALFILPAASALISLVLQNTTTLYIWLTPLFTTLSVVSMWSIILSNIATRTQVSQFTLPIMMSLSLSLNLSYTLILLARYLEDASNTSSRVIHMLRKEGPSVLFSGIIFISISLGLHLVPLPMTKGISIGVTTAAGSALFVNLILLPALLQTSLSDWVVSFRCKQVLKRIESSRADVEKNGKNIFFAYDGISDQQYSLWYKFSELILHPVRSVVILASAISIILFVAAYAVRVQSFVLKDLLPTVTNPSLDGFHSFGDKAGMGSVSPYHILFDGRASNQPIISEKGFDVMHLVIDEISAAERDESNGVTHLSSDPQEAQEMTNQLMQQIVVPHKKKKSSADHESEEDTNCGERYTSYLGVAVMDNARIPHSLFLSKHFCSKVKPYCPVEILRMLHALDQASTSENKFATYVTVNLGLNPFSAEGKEWLRDARETIRRLEESGVLSGVQVHIEGDGAIVSDVVDIMRRASSKAFATSVVGVLVSLAIFFRSFKWVLRTIVTSSLTLAFSFGFYVIAHQIGIFQPAGNLSTNYRDGEYHWLVPPATCVTFGLALFFDIFMTNRVMQYRFEGFNNTFSVKASMLKSGRIVTGVASIMALSFGSLLLCNNNVLKQLSFILVTAAILEASIMQTIVSPLLTWITEEYGCWPRNIHVATEEPQQENNTEVPQFVAVK